MITLLTDIRQRIDELGSLRYIDNDWGQLDDYGVNPPTKWPCVLVDIIDAKPESQGNHIQIMDCTVLIRLADLRTSNSSQRAPQAQQSKHYDLLSIASSIFAKLHGWHKADSSYGTLSRVGFRRHHRDDGIREYHILFRTILRDDAAKILTKDLHELVPRDIKPEIIFEPSQAV